MRTLALIVSVITLAGCSSGDPVHVADVQVADAPSVASCKYLDTVYGTSSWYGVFAEKGVENARVSAFEKARSLGATHVVWEPIPQSYGSSQVAAKVYRCPMQ